MPPPARSPRTLTVLPRLLALLLVAGTFATLPASAASPSSAAATSPNPASADEEYRVLIAKDRERISTGAPVDLEAHLNRAQARFIFMYDHGLAFIEKYPADPRRWDVLVLLPYGRDHEMRVQPGGAKQLLPVAASLRQWEQRYYPMLEGLLAAPDASKDARTAALRQLIEFHTRRVHQEPPANDAATVAKVQGWLRTFQREFPNSGALPSTYQRVAVMLMTVDPAQCRDFLNELSRRHASDSPTDQMIRSQLTGRLRVLEGIAQPVDSLWAQLQSLDPTFLDLSPYRGKVVLVAMGPVSWTTHTTYWEQLYAEHHAAGFEIIQVVHHNTNPAAPPEQRDQTAMKKFVAINCWPWRVLWDPRGYGEDFSAIWGQSSIPAYLLIGRDGRITNYRSGPSDYATQIPRALAESPGP